jgi:hypothetical protein
MNKAIRKLEAQLARIRKNVKPVKVVRVVAVQVAPVLTKAEQREAAIFNAFSAREHESFLAMGELMLRTGR